MKRLLIVSTVILVLLCALSAASLITGGIWLDPRTAFGHGPENELARLVFFDLRMPRTVLAILIGATLGLSGAALQGLTRNPLAEPGLLGVSSGAALGASIAIYFGVSSLFSAAIPIMGLLGALGAMSLTFALGRGGGTLSLVLAGSSVTMLTGALISLALNFAPSPYAAYEILTWLMGSLTDRSWEQVVLVAPFMVTGMAILIYTARGLDALSLGEIQAESLGIRLEHIRIMALIGTAMAVGAATSVSGAIGFIGLVAPHIVRPFVGYQPSRILLPAALLGAVLLLGADMATRVIRVGPEMRLGVFTSLIGTPFFFWLVARLRKSSP